jgi:hypothetical protein
VKNQVWLALSFTVLSNIAAASTELAEQGSNSTQKITTSGETGKHVKALELTKKPAFEKSMPCYGK